MIGLIPVGCYFAGMIVFSVWWWLKARGDR